MTDKGVIVEFDFTAIDGAEILFRTARDFLRDLDGIELDERTEAKYLAGGSYQGAFAELFAVVKTKKTAAKAARDFAAAFCSAIDEAVAKPVSPAFRKFLKVLTDRGVRVVLATRADPEKAAAALAPLLSENVALYREESTTYGCVKWDAWRLACVRNRLRPYSTVAVTGSGLGVRSALFAGLVSVAVSNDHVAYQDFSGADDVVQELNAAAAKRVLESLRVD